MSNPARRLQLALALSLALHLALLGLGPPAGKVSPRSTALRARLLPPATVQPVGPLLKDTLAEEKATPQASPPKPRPEMANSRRPAPRTPEAAAQRKLSEVLFYPPEAVARGLEGEVRLLLTLDESGRILDAVVAAGSGHAILDAAALRAVRAMGSLPQAEGQEVILPVVFRLR
ncbi:MAG: TonB family protein [Rhodocyclaceae bacterium]|jgi:protein TonB